MDAPASPHRPLDRFSAVVLAGGTARRMGGVDKGGLEVGGKTLLENALSAVDGADEVVVVGEVTPTSRPVLWARESPPGGGPAAGLLAALGRLSPAAELVAVLAVDMPRVHSGTLTRLRSSLAPAYDGVVLVDQLGRTQPLCGVYRVGALRGTRRVDGETSSGLAMHVLLTDLKLGEVAAVGEEAQDVDTWDDLAALDGTTPDLACTNRPRVRRWLL